MRCPRSVIIGLAFALLTGCFEWTEDAQGNLRSIGVPGLPVWQAQPTPARAIQSGSNDASPAPAEPQMAELSAGGAGNGIWLAELNRWRESAGVTPVSENSELSAGSQQHARYLVMQGPQADEPFRLYAGGLGAAGHTEASGSKWYTAAGAQAAGGGKRVPRVMQGADVTFEGRGEAEEIDSWLIGPFHRFSLLAPWAQVAGFGSFGQYPRSAAALALRGAMPDSEEVTVIKFPPDGSSVLTGTMYLSEWPDPLAPCPGYQLPVGLPITVQLGRHVHLASHSLP